MSRWCLLGMLLWIAGCAASSPQPQPQPTSPLPPPPSAPALQPDESAALVKEAKELYDREDWKGYVAVLERCLEASKNHPECHYMLGVGLERLEQPGPALQHYFAALRREPMVPHYYPEPVQLCLTYKLYDTAKALADAGLARIPAVTEEAHALRIAQFQVAQAHKDQAGMMAAMQGAYASHHDRHPETGFGLGTMYAVSDPSRKQQASALLWEFLTHVCRGTEGRHFMEQCEVAQSLVQKLGGEVTEPRGVEASLPLITPPLKPSVLLPLPPVPQIPERPLRSGDAYTVWGASVLLRSGHHRESGQSTLAITGVVGKSNVDEAPLCALHRRGIADPENCKPPIPTFWLCDSLDASPDDCIQVMGWASNFAEIWGAILQARKPHAQPYRDMFWGKEIPSPIPQRGARATVTGQYGVTFEGASSRAVTDSIMGILIYQRLDWIEPPRENPKFPGM
jgi:hypothetical protein